ncbi:methyl-accepting chemotaxis protein [Paenibacillus polymyxa]|uniref:methyl-accepting chemotaxis protein n=2 Tax=Paenibacillus polymyxa TaxID=1406 RepID=UPI0025B6812F|nr:methyl-accepting chemotaxis protein [Paenibacillus polymyxa]
MNFSMQIILDPKGIELIKFSDVDEESSESAQKITDLVQIIQNDTNHAIQAVKVNNSETETGIKMVNAAGQAFEQISDAVKKAAGEIQAVSGRSQEMSSSTNGLVVYGADFQCC